MEAGKGWVSGWEEKKEKKGGVRGKEAF